MSYAIGIDLGGSSVKAVAVTGSGEILHRENAPFEATDAMAWAREIERVVAELERRQGTEADGLGLSAPGLAAKDGRSIAHMPGRLAGLEGLHWTKFLNRKRETPVLNDAHAALLGELWIGAAKGHRNAIMLTLGTGVGGAAMVDGHLLRGEIGRAGHLGHSSLDPDGPPDVCGMPGSLEVAIGNCTIVERTGGKFRSTHELIAAHQNGDETATRIWLASVKKLAAAIASFINILDPALVVIGGGVARAGPLLFEPLAQYLRPMEWQAGGHKVKVAAAQLGEYAGACGAAFHSLNREAQSQPNGR